MKNWSITIIFISTLLTSCTDRLESESLPPQPLNADVERDCETKRLLPYRGTKNAQLVIEDISINSLDSMAQSLSKKISNDAVLSKAEDTRLIMIMNTYSWSQYDKVDAIIDTTKSIQKLEAIFKEKYSVEMRCKYHAYLGTGMGIYYEELEISYTGSPGVNSRYRIVE